MTSKNLEKLAVDANPILSAIIGGRAKEIFLKADALSFYTTLFNFKEVEKYIPIFSSKRNIPLDELFFVLSLLPLVVYEEVFYKKELVKAKGLIGKRDPDDAHLLALSIKIKSPIWSNDKDFEMPGVEVYSTLDLIKLLEGINPISPAT